MRDASDKMRPPAFNRTVPVYPLLRQLVRVTGQAGPVYTGFVQQCVGNTSQLRDREPCYAFEPNGVVANDGWYKMRLVGNYNGLPLFVFTLACCQPKPPPASSPSVRISSSSLSCCSLQFQVCATVTAASSSSLSSSPAAASQVSSAAGGGSVSSSLSTVLTQCCPQNPFPFVVHATFSGGTNDCAALDGLVVTLTYDPLTLSWSGTYTGPNGGASKLVVICAQAFPSGYNFTIQSQSLGGIGQPTGCIFSAASSNSFSCNPIDVIWNNLSINGSCCSGTVNVEVTA